MVSWPGFLMYISDCRVSETHARLLGFNSIFRSLFSVPVSDGLWLDFSFDTLAIIIYEYYLI